jgi:hypothetical protein
MSRLQFSKTDEGVALPPGGLPNNFGSRAYDPSAGADDGEGAGHSGLLDACSGDWSWKPKRRLVITGPLCTCTLVAPVGTACFRHSSYKAPTKNPLQTVITLN